MRCASRSCPLQTQYRELVERQRAEQQAQAERERAESKVLQALTPVQETLRTMQHKVTELETQREPASTASCQQQLKCGDRVGGAPAQHRRGARIRAQSNSTRGVWGETQLRNVVQAAGLIERVDFDVQSQVSSDAGAAAPTWSCTCPAARTSRSTRRCRSTRTSRRARSR